MVVERMLEEASPLALVAARQAGAGEREACRPLQQIERDGRR